MNKKRDRLNDESGFSRFATHAVLIFASFLAFGPFVWMFLTSIKTYEETIQIPMKFLPEVAQWVNYSIVSDKLNFPQLYLNTILVTIMMIIGQILIVTICAYAFDRLKFPGKNVLFMRERRNREALLPVDERVRIAEDNRGRQGYFRSGNGIDAALHIVEFEERNVGIGRPRDKPRVKHVRLRI